MNPHQWSFAKQNSFKSRKCWPKSAKTSWSQLGYCNKPTKLQISVNFIRKILMLSKCYESTKVDRRTWKHVPPGTHRSTSEVVAFPPYLLNMMHLWYKNNGPIEYNTSNIRDPVVWIPLMSIQSIFRTVFKGTLHKTVYIKTTDLTFWAEFTFKKTYRVGLSSNARYDFVYWY